MEMLGPPRVTVIDGSSVAWTELGKGPPLVLLHGLADSHRTWRRAAPALASRFRVLMPDLPGHGLSSRPDVPYTLEWYARTMLGWLDAAGVEHAHLVGHSFGGGVAQWMVLEQRARVERLVLVASGGLGPEVSVGLRLASLPYLGRWLAQPLMGVGTHVMMRLAGQGSAEEIARAAWLNRAPGTGRAFYRTLSGCIDLIGQRIQTWDRIADLDLPPLALVWGERDPILPFRQALRAERIIEGATLARYEGVGHFPHLERAERFARDVEAFLVGRLESTLPTDPSLRSGVRLESTLPTDPSLRSGVRLEPARLRVYVRPPQPARLRRWAGRIAAAFRRIFTRTKPSPAVARGARAARSRRDVGKSDAAGAYERPPP